MFKKVLGIVFVAALVLGMSTVVMASDNDEFEIFWDRNPYGLTFEEAKEKFFRLMDEYDSVCWFSNGLPLEYAIEITEAWDLANPTPVRFACEDAKITVENITNVEFYQMMLEQYLAGEPNAMSSFELQQLEELAILLPEGNVAIINFYFPSFADEPFEEDVNIEPFEEDIYLEEESAYLDEAPLLARQATFSLQVTGQHTTVDDFDKGAPTAKNRHFHHISKKFATPLALPKIV